jgi:hypothetical protein
VLKTVPDKEQAAVTAEVKMVTARLTKLQAWHMWAGRMLPPHSHETSRTKAVTLPDYKLVTKTDISLSRSSLTVSLLNFMGFFLVVWGLSSGSCACRCSTT